MDPTLPFRFKVPKTTEVDGSNVTGTSFRVHGYLGVDGDRLIVEWGGTVQVRRVGAMGVRDETQSLADERLAIPIADVYRAELAGGWLRPRLTVQARRVGALASLPSEHFGVVDFWYDRSERFTAIAVLQALTEAIEHAASTLLDGESDFSEGGVARTPPDGTESAG
jgi:hypothetical protein